MLAHKQSEWLQPTAINPEFPLHVPHLSYSATSTGNHMRCRACATTLKRDKAFHNVEKAVAGGVESFGATRIQRFRMPEVRRLCPQPCVE